MKTQSLDTDPKVEAELVARLRGLSLAQKFSQVRSLTETTMRLSRRAIWRNHQGMDEKSLNCLLVELCYGKELATQFQSYLENQTR